MIKIEHIKVSNLEGAIRGLRNPLNSWDKSDSFSSFTKYTEIYFNEDKEYIQCDFEIGPADLRLAQRMVTAGTDEAKFMRQIFVCFDLTAPLFYWKEFDTYKVGTVSNSCSTMHTLAREPITAKNFSFNADEKLTELSTENYLYMRDMIKDIIEKCEWLRQKFMETKDKRYWRLLVQMLPNAWNQKRTITLNYQVLRAQYFSRRNHKLSEWREYCNFIEKLPYGKELICFEKEVKNGGQ